MTRRAFAASVGGAAAMAFQGEKAKPNILWLVSEDIGPQLGAYGDAYANTPNLDKFAARSLRYDCCWSNAPVCAPARTSIISGMYPTSTGAEHMRSLISLPAGMKMFPQYLREAGYYCSNNTKEDYNLTKVGQVWDESSFGATYKKRAAGQPFFAVFNFGITHESQVLRRKDLNHDPAKAKLPAYYPDTPGVRNDLAQYYDNITTMDGQFAQALKQLEESGQAEDTIVFFYGDNGKCLPRGKRIPLNSGLIVPLIVHVPEKFKHLAPPDYKAGGNTDRPVSFVDLAPTVLNLVGLEVPGHMQGTPFLGRQTKPAPQFIHGFRGRMDERVDLMRATRDRRYVYVRNYMPHRIYGEHVTFQWQQSTMREWDKLYHEGKLKAPQTYFWETKPYEELYDLKTDPDEVRNLASSKAHQAVLVKLRRAQDDWMRTVKDVGLLPEPEMQARAKGATPYEMGHDAGRYAFESVKKAADAAASGDAKLTPQLKKDMSNADSAVRYWAAVGLLIRKQAVPELKKALEDASPSVKIVAAEALGRYGTAEEKASALRVLLDLASPKKNGMYVAGFAWNSIDQLPVDLLKTAKAEIEAMEVGPETGFARAGAAAGGGNRGGAGAAAQGLRMREGSFDLFGAGMESEESRAGGGARLLKTTVMEKLSR